MKKILSVLLAVAILFSVTIISVSAENTEPSDELFQAIVAFNNYKDIEKSDIDIEYCDHIRDDKYLVKYHRKMSGVPGIMERIEVGDYVLYTNHPIPLIYANGVIYEIEDAFDKGVIDNTDLHIMSKFPKLHMVKNKITDELSDEMAYYNNDDYVNIRFLVEGSEMTLNDIENWVDDIRGSIEKLNAHYEDIHKKLVNNVLKDIDHIERVHNSGVSIIAIKKRDIEIVSDFDFVTEMDYISEVHMKYIDTYKPKLTEYIYDEKYRETDESGESFSYYLINAHSRLGSSAVVAFRFGDYIIESSAIYSDFTYGYGIYDIQEDKFYDVYDLRDTPYKYHRLEDGLSFYSRAKYIADTDGDGATTVMDATNIQRYSAKLEHEYMDEYISHNSESCLMGDVDNDSEITVLDATAVQKIIAKFDIGF